MAKKTHHTPWYHGVQFPFADMIRPPLADVIRSPLAEMTKSIEDLSRSVTGPMDRAARYTTSVERATRYTTAVDRADLDLGTSVLADMVRSPIADVVRPPKNFLAEGIEEPCPDLRGEESTSIHELIRSIAGKIDPGHLPLGPNAM